MTAIAIDDISLRRLLAPLSVEAFFDEYYDRKPVHVPGESDRFAEVFSWAAFNSMYEMASLWTAKSLELAMDGKGIPPDQYCFQGADREGNAAMRPNPERIRDFVRQGATITADYIDTLSPGIRAVARSIEINLGAATTCNAFCSWDRRKGYGPHFDTLQVFALQIAGEKVWKIYKGRMHPASEVPGFTAAAFTLDQHERQKGPVVAEVRMKPGDVLYVPQGQYHEALAEPGGSLHLSFGARAYTGIDVMNLLIKELPKHPLFRRALPHFDERDGLVAQMGELADVIGTFFRQPENADQIRVFQRDKAFERFPGVRFPARELTRHYRVRSRGTVVENGSGWSLVAGNRRTALGDAAGSLAQWAWPRDYFTLDQARQALPVLDDDGLDRATEELARADFVDPL